MPGSPTTRELTVRNGDVSLAGSLWLPPDPAGVTVLMHPGSGPSDRDNDVFFPPIRQHLLDSGVTVASFDKRGVGESTGRWQDAAIEEQASDAIACLEALRGDTSLSGSVGLYGHSQGGWVVIEAATRSPYVAFVVTSSGPGVTPGEQERWATRMYMAKAGIPEGEMDEVGRYYDRVISMMRSGLQLADAREQLAADGFPPAFESLSLPVLPDHEADWRLIAALIDYEPTSGAGTACGADTRPLRSRGPDRSRGRERRSLPRGGAPGPPPVGGLRRCRPSARDRRSAGFR